MNTYKLKPITITLATKLIVEYIKQEKLDLFNHKYKQLITHIKNTLSHVKPDLLSYDTYKRVPIDEIFIYTNTFDNHEAYLSCVDDEDYETWEVEEIDERFQKIFSCKYLIDSYSDELLDNLSKDIFDFLQSIPVDEDGKIELYSDNHNEFVRDPIKNPVKRFFDVLDKNGISSHDAISAKWGFKICDESIIVFNYDNAYILQDGVFMKCEN